VVTLAPETENPVVEPERLPPGRHGIPREAVELSQKQRLHAAMVDLVADQGYLATNVEMVAKHAGVSKATFYENFANKEECFWSANDERFTELALVIDDGYENGGDRWQQKVRGGITALLHYLGTEKGFAHVVFVEALALGKAGLGRRQLVLTALRTYFEPKMRPEMAPLNVDHAELRAQATVDALAGLIFSNVLEGNIETLPGMVEDFVWIALQPYGGEDA
jgi:AcrR family transcriptional regulator